MSCKYKNKCPSASGWCNGNAHGDSECIPFLLSAYKNNCVQKDKIIEEISNLAFDYYTPSGQAVDLGDVINIIEGSKSH